MIIRFTAQSQKQFEKLPKQIAQKFYKQGSLLLINPKHPSLRARKKGGSDIYETRVDYHYRFTYTVYEGDVYILSIGPHDEGLGIK